MRATTHEPPTSPPTKYIPPNVAAKIPLPRRMIAPLMILAGQGLQSAVNFLIGVLMARFASVTGLGEYSLGITVLFLTASLTETLIATPFTYVVLRQRSLRARNIAFGTALVATFALASLSGAIFAVIILFVPSLASLLPALPAALVMTLMREMIRRRHYALGEPGRALQSDLITMSLQLVVVGALIAAGRFSAASAFAASAFACLVAICVGLTGLRPNTAISLRLLMPYCRRYIRYGHWLALGGTCQIIALQSFPWFLYVTSDARATGAFIACLAISNLPNPFLVGMTNFARPAMMRTFTEDGWPALLRQTMVLELAFVLPVVVFALAAISVDSQLLVLIYGADLAGATGTLAWTVLALVAVSVAAPLQLLMLAVHRPRAILYLHLGELAAAYLIGLPLVISLGLPGAGIGYFATALAGLMVLAVVFAVGWRRGQMAGST